MRRTLSGANLFVIAAGLVALACGLHAQEATKEEMNHDFIFDLPGLSRQHIYGRSMNWITNNLRSRKAVIQSDDPDAGSIVANGITALTAEGDSVAVSLSFRMSVDVREGKERVRLLDLQISRGPDQGWDEIPGEGSWHRSAQKKFIAMARSLNEYIKLKGGP